MPTPKWIERDAGVARAPRRCARVRQRELAVVGAARGAGPRIEDLDRLRAGFDLRAQVVGDHVGEAIAEPVPRRGLRVHERLGPRVAGRRPAFDRVGGQRERRAAEADQRHASVELAPQQPDRLEHVPERLARLERAQPIDVGRGADRMCDRRPFALDEIEVQPHRREGQQQVGEENRGVDVDRVDRLQRDRDSELGLRGRSRAASSAARSAR